jgi:DNA-binding transcriptional regulator YiaG
MGLQAHESSSPIAWPLGPVLIPLGLFDRACLTPVMELSPAAIRRIRAKAAVSQAVFAAHLNVTTGVVSKWERGEKQPRGPAAKLLTLAAKNGIAAIAWTAPSYGSKMSIDATRKWQAEGFTCPWHAMIEMDRAIKAKINAI